MRVTTGMLAIIAFVVVAALGMFTFLIYHERDISPLANLRLVGGDGGAPAPGPV